MIRITIARKYSRALLEIGLKEGTHEALGQELEKIAQLLQAVKELRNILGSSVYPAPLRKGIFQKIAHSLRLSATMTDFVNLLIERDRMNHWPEICQSYRDLSDTMANRMRARLLTASPLSPELVTEVRRSLESSLGKEIVMTTQEDPTLIGGVVAKIGNLVYDGSIRSQLWRIKENLHKE